MSDAPTARERAAQRARGAEWFRSLGNADKGRLGDELVLGEFDWREWLASKPTSAFLNGADQARMDWEATE